MTGDTKAARVKPEVTVMADRRARILAVAAARFAEFGFGATTVRQIADDVDILSGSLYHHFATKEEILGEIVRDAALQLHRISVGIAAAPADAEQRLVALILADLGELTAHQSVHAILFNERKFFRRSPDFGYVVKAKRETYDAWQRVLSEGLDEGLFRPDIDIFLTISTIVRLLNAGADWYTHEDGSPLDTLKNFSLDELTDFYLAFILRAVRTADRAGDAVPREAAEKLIALTQNLQPSAC
ncbi:MAG: TetR/AcrR family transcriptional regulator [Novosphingobium sp.]